MWLLSHHYTSPPGSSWKCHWLAGRAAPPGHGVPCGGLGQCVETSSVAIEDFLGEQHFSDAQLSVRFSSFHTLSFFQDLTAAALGKNKQTKTENKKTALPKNSHLFPSTSNLTKGILCICQYYLSSPWLNVERTAGQDGEWRKEKKKKEF